MNKDKLLKEMKKAVKKVRKKNEIDDVLDSNRVAEMSDAPSGTEGVMRKKKEDCNCKGESKEDCECEEAAPMDKAEEIVKSIINNFKKILSDQADKMCIQFLGKVYQFFTLRFLGVLNTVRTPNFGHFFHYKRE